jgi:deazaflavin-dependent oxidoreductase (nitroreductase family)
VSVDLTPSGTRGFRVPKLPRLLRKPLYGLVHMLLNRAVRRRGEHLLTLTTLGARSGIPHTIPLSWYPDRDNAWLVIASFGGAARHPAWYINMAKHPDQVWIELGGHKIKVRPESLRGSAREQAWQRIVAVAPQYDQYQQQTDREIPVVRLTPAE